MKSNKKNINSNSFSQFLKEFGGVIGTFESSVEGVMDIITGSFESTRKDSEAITSLFRDSRGEAEAIFSIFSGIAGIFTGSSGGILSTILELFPGGDIISTLLGNSVSPVYTGPDHSMYPPGSGHAPAPAVIVNTQLEKAGMYRVYREGKILSELRPS